MIETPSVEELDEWAAKTILGLPGEFQSNNPEREYFSGGAIRSVHGVHEYFHPHKDLKQLARVMTAWGGDEEPAVKWGEVEELIRAQGVDAEKMSNGVFPVLRIALECPEMVLRALYDVVEKR